MVEILICIIVPAAAGFFAGYLFGPERGCAPVFGLCVLFVGALCVTKSALYAALPAAVIFTLAATVGLLIGSAAGERGNKPPDRDA